MSRKQAIISLLLAGVLTLSLTGLTLAAGCAVGQTEYTVQRGDWVYKIARAFGVKPEDILKANPLVNPNLVFPGQKLCIPAKAPGTATTAPSATATTGPTRTPAPTATPGPTATPRPTSLPGYVCCPSFRIIAVERDKSVTIETKNFPPGLKFDVRMAARGNHAIGGTVAGSQDSGTGGVFRATFNIPAGQKGLDQIAIRLENPVTGYFAFNWFYNTTATVP